MCQVCASFRSPAIHSEFSGGGGESAGTRHVRRLLNRRTTRAGWLTRVGAGLAGAMTAGTLGWNVAHDAADDLPHVVLIVLDGARPEYFNVPNIPHVRALMAKGTQYTNAFAGILESETPSGHVSIGTGSEPSRTGIPSFWWANTDNERVSLFSPTKVRAGDMEQIVQKAGVPTLAHLVHAKSPRAKVVALSGSKYYAADAIGGPDADVTMYFYGNAQGHFVPTYIPGHPPPAGLLNRPGMSAPSTHLARGTENHLAMHLATETFKQMRQQVTLINLPEFDWPLGHVDGGITDMQTARTLMQHFDQDLAVLQDAYRQAGVLDNTVFVLMADHGMTPLHHTVSETDLVDAVNRAGSKIVAQTFTTASYFWLEDSSKAGLAAQYVTALRNPHIQSVYARPSPGKPYARVSGAGLRANGIEPAHQYLLNSFNGPDAPDVVILFNEHTGCEPGGQANWKADHGGTSWQAQHLPLIFSGPGVRSGHVSSYPARLIDIAPTVLQLMGASHKGMQGIPLADALTAAPSWTVQWQQAAAHRLMPVVTALQQQSHYGA